jgi:chromosome segregation ATPase
VLQAKQTTDLKNARRDVADYEYMLETERKGLQTKIRDLQTCIAEMDAEKDSWRTRANQFSEVSQEQLDENVRVIGEKNAEIDQLKGDIVDLQHRLDAMSMAVQETELAKVRHCLAIRLFVFVMLSC